PHLRCGSGELPQVRRSDALGGGSEDGESCTAANANGQARPCPAPTARYTSDPARSAEFAVRELNGALFDADLSFEVFEGVHWSIFLGCFCLCEGFVDER